MLTSIILTGSTGFIGTHVLLHLLSLPCPPTTIYLPLRRSLPSDHPAVSHPAYSIIRVHQLVRSDLVAAFHDPADHKMKGALASSASIIWCIGAPWGEFASHSLVDYVYLTHTVTLSAARAFASSLSGSAKTPRQKKTFVLCSDAFVTRGEDASKGWIKSEWVTRDVKGRTEADLLALLPTYQCLRIGILRPGGVLQPSDGPLSRMQDFVAKNFTVRVDLLAAALCRAALDRGVAREFTWENGEVVEIGTAALEKERAHGEPVQKIGVPGEWAGPN